MVKFTVIFLCLFTLNLKSVELNSVLRGCSDYDTECNGNGGLKEAVDGSDEDIQIEFSDETITLLPVIWVAQDCIEQNCSGISATARFIRIAAMGVKTTYQVYPGFLFRKKAAERISGIGKSNRALSRIKRHPPNCNDALGTIDYAVNECITSQDFIHCKIRCAHGYAFKEGDKIVTKTERKCYHSQPFWYPYPDFPICEPYINCKTHLIRDGVLSCHRPLAVDSPAFCNIKCHADDDVEELPTASYECVDDKYNKILPFCASTDKGEKLIGHPIDV